jgi:hypothetical protein
MQRLLFLLTSFLLCATAAAQDVPTDLELLEEVEPELRRYTVEVIVFAYAEDVSVGTELFLPDVIEPEPELPEILEDDSIPTFTDKAEEIAQAVLEAAAEEEETRFEMVLLMQDELTMIDTLDRLDSLDAYEPLLHIGWTQTALPEAETPKLDLREFGQPPAGLTGDFTLYLSRYLHLVVNLQLDAPETEEATVHFGEEPMQVDRYESDSYEYYGRVLEPEPMYEPLRFQISENRLFKNGEIRYYDHPKFGVVAKILRFEIEEEDNTDDTEFLLPAVASE